MTSFGIIPQKLILVKEALEVGQENLEGLKQMLMQIISGVADVKTAGVNGGDKAILAKFQNIQNLAESVSEEVKEARVKDLDTEDLDKRLMASVF
ncbi:MAG: hypothetical protein RTV72_15575 [Candidatus Thorarchaeota archaeon]